MSGGRFLVGSKDINCSERNVKRRNLLKEGIDLFESNVLKTTETEKEDGIFYMY